jgi:prevent-host-death family protein
MTFSVHEAKTQFSKLLDLVESGEEVLIVRRGKPVAQLVQSRRPGKPQFGAMREEPAWPEGWDRPWGSGEADQFWEGR